MKMLKSEAFKWRVLEVLVAVLPVQATKYAVRMTG
jgi:hypothetical protein